MEPVKKISGFAKIIAAALTVQAAVGGGLVLRGVQIQSLVLSGVGMVLIVTAALETLRIMIKASRYG